MFFTENEMKNGRLNCLCGRNRALSAFNPAVPEMMKIAMPAVSTARIGNTIFAFLRNVPTVPAKGREKRRLMWNVRR